MNAKKRREKRKKKKKRKMKKMKKKMMKKKMMMMKKKKKRKWEQRAKARNRKTIFKPWWGRKPDNERAYQKVKPSRLACNKGNR